MMENLSLVEIDNQSLRTQNFQLFKQVDSLKDENKHLRKALKYYANKDIYFVSDDNAAEFDQGERARKALEFCESESCK